MKLSLAGLWQVSPLTDLSIPQDDIYLPAQLGQALPLSLSQPEISAQEWHLMHDIELNDELTTSAVDLVFNQVSHYAEVRLNGVAVYDCLGDGKEYRKNVRPHLQSGRNRIELLFLEQDEDWLLEEDKNKGNYVGNSLLPIEVASVPYLHFMRNIRLNQVDVEQVWHHGGGCEVLVHLSYEVFKFDLASASVQFNGVTLQLPIDMRSDHLTALFQVEAPEHSLEGEGELLRIEVEDHRYEFFIPLNPSKERVRFGV